MAWGEHAKIAVASSTDPFATGGLRIAHTSRLRSPRPVRLGGLNNHSQQSSYLGTSNGALTKRTINIMSLRRTTMPSAVPSVAIIGGGPGGLFTAHLLRTTSPIPLQITLYEATDRVGGKIVTRTFDSAPIAYEAGAAELYDYTRLGDDPLRQLIASLGLRTVPMEGSAVILDGRLIPDFAATRHTLGEATWQALRHFDVHARGWMSPREFYEKDWTVNAPDAFDTRTLHEHIAEVPDAQARRYLETLIHSDLATEPHATSASYGLQNYLMNNAAYMGLYALADGMEELPRALQRQLAATIRLREPVVAVERTMMNMLQVESTHHGVSQFAEYDVVVAALPNDWLPAIRWRGERLAHAMHQHHVHYDHPAHYLRVSALFDTPFWRTCWEGSYVMLDAFGGCCLYDESSRTPSSPTAVMGWLLAGEAALRLANLPDAQLIDRVLEALPPMLQHGRSYFREAKVHRWVGAVNGLPGGVPAQSLAQRHMPEPIDHPHLLVVGDYLFDATINGVLDSAGFVAETIIEWLMQRNSNGRPSPASDHREVM